MADEEAMRAFLDEAEKVLRTEYLPQCPDLVLWRGIKKQETYDGNIDVETIIVGMSDDSTGKQLPAITLLEAWAYGNAHVNFEHSPDEIEKATAVLGGIGAISQVREAAHYLMDFRS